MSALMAILNRAHHDSRCGIYRYPHSDCNCGIGAARAELQSLRHPWISVKDRLPEEEPLDVLAYNGSVCLAEYTHKLGFRDSRPDMHGWILDGITHWMPLPEPPRTTSSKPEGDDGAAAEFPKKEDGVG